MKTLLFTLMLVSALVITTGIQAQTPWYIGGNTGVSPQSANKVGTTNAFDLNVITGNKVRMTFKHSPTLSNIGIGTATPLTNYGVHILGGIGDPLAQGLYIQRADAGGSNQDGALSIDFSTSSFSGGGTTGGSCNFILHPTPNSLIPDMAFSTNNVSPQLIIKNNGYVGVGTSNPLAKFHVDNGAIRITGPNPSGGPMILFGGSSTVASGGEWGIEYTTATPGHDGLNFWKPFGSTGTSGNSFLFLHNDGMVGVNTDNPTAQLTVNGNMLIGDPSTTTLPAGYKLYVETGILTEKVKVAVKNSSNWADYVFAPGYKLMPLKEVKKYVETNKHLPDVPSAKEMENNGLDLGSMAALQMQKIEELTLQLIQINERLETVEKENAALKTTIDSSKKQKK